MVFREAHQSISKAPYIIVQSLSTSAAERPNSRKPCPCKEGVANKIYGEDQKGGRTIFRKESASWYTQDHLVHVKGEVVNRNNLIAGGDFRMTGGAPPFVEIYYEGWRCQA